MDFRRCLVSRLEDRIRDAAFTLLASESPPLRSLLCYSCQLTIKDMSSEEVLPQYILSEAERRLRRSQLREEIRDFLLEDEADEG